MIIEITVVNNRTNKEYTYKCTTGHGLTWPFFNNNYDSFTLKQFIGRYTKEDVEKYEVIGMFRDFSICNVVRKETND